MPESNSLELLRELLNRRPQELDALKGLDFSMDPLAKQPGPGLPFVPPAPPFRQQTTVIGSPAVANTVEGLMRIAPELRGRISTVQVGPNRAAAEDLMDSGIHAENFPSTTLNGIFDSNTRDIALNPGFYNASDKLTRFGRPIEQTIAHEMAHAAGYGHGSDINQIEKLMLDREVQKRLKPTPHRK